MQDKSKPVLTPEQWYFVCQCFDKWIDAKIAGDSNFQTLARNWSEDEAKIIVQILNQLKPDFWHSALLWRMLVEGKDPLQFKPKLKNSYPDYGD